MVDDGRSSSEVLGWGLFSNDYFCLFMSFQELRMIFEVKTNGRLATTWGCLKIGYHEIRCLP